MEQTWFTAMVWMALALGASLISLRIGMSVALVEIVAGSVGGNFLNLHPADWINVLAAFGAMAITFLAGTEVDQQVLRKQWKATFAIGVVSFLAPFLGAMACAYWLLDWSLQASQIAGIALSTTSVAVVYAVLVERGYNETELGKVIL